MSWRTVILTQNAKISLRLNHLVVKTDQIKTVALEEISVLIIENPNIVMTGHLLNALSQYKITTIICNEQHLPHAQLNLIYGHFRQPSIIKEQINWPKERKELLWQQITKQKISNQKQVLQRFYPNEDYSNFDKYITYVEPGDVTNREGHAAKVYFNELFGKSFIRGAETVTNWALNYGYALLSSLITRIIITKGLLTELGIHHRNQYNSYNLSSDLMEVYRPFIDDIVKSNIVNEFGKDERRVLIEIFNQKILIRGQKQFLANSIHIFVDSVIKYLNSDKETTIHFPLITSEGEEGV